jgi:hypothetical protein
MDLDMSIRWIAPFTRTSKLYWTSGDSAFGRKADNLHSQSS